MILLISEVILLLHKLENTAEQKEKRTHSVAPPSDNHGNLRSAHDHCDPPTASLLRGPLPPLTRSAVPFTKVRGWQGSRTEQHVQEGGRLVSQRRMGSPGQADPLQHHGQLLAMKMPWRVLGSPLLSLLFCFTSSDTFKFLIKKKKCV